MFDLRSINVETSADFKTLSPNSPLPWSEYHTPETGKVVIVDANNRDVCTIQRDTYEDSLRAASMILCAVNTCGGIKMTDS